MGAIKNQNLIYNVHSQTHLAPPKIKVYKYRWVILVMFIMSAVLNNFQWIQYSSISNAMQKYYGVQSAYIDWLSIIFLLAFLPLNYPGMWLMDKKGLKVITVLGSLLNCIAAWIKVVSVRPDLFYVTFIGQTVAGVVQVYTHNAPTRIAAVWFGQDQASTACSIAVFALLLGAALGLIIPPIVVKPHESINEIGKELWLISYFMAAICTVHLLIVIFFFRSEPELPPSPGQATRVTETLEFFDSFKRLSRNRGFVILIISYGLIEGVFSAVMTILSQMVLVHFPDHQEDAGRIGLTLIISGMLGSVFSGVFLDKTHTFKTTALALYLFSTLGMVAFTFSLHTNIAAIYGVSGLLGFFMVAFLLVGYEFSVEITYPEPEGTTSGLINTSANVFGVLLTLGASSLLDAVGDVWANVALTVTLLIGTIMTAFIKQDLRRQEAHSIGGKVTSA